MTLDQHDRTHRARVRFTADQLARLVVLPADTRVVTAVADPLCGTVDVLIEGEWLPHTYSGSEPPAWDLPLRWEPCLEADHEGRIADLEGYLSLVGADKGRAQILVNLVRATLTFHWQEFAGNIIPGQDRHSAKVEFDDAVEAYRRAHGMSGVAAAENHQ